MKKAVVFSLAAFIQDAANRALTASQTIETKTSMLHLSVAVFHAQVLKCVALLNEIFAVAAEAYSLRL